MRVGCVTCHVTGDAVLAAPAPTFGGERAPHPVAWLSTHPEVEGALRSLAVRERVSPADADPLVPLRLDDGYRAGDRAWSRL